MTLGDGAVLVPLVAVILFFALYPQLALHKGEGAVTAAIRPAATIAHAPPTSPAAAPTPIQVP
jgi:NADH-quinone oxidoreductase subunit M